MTGKVRTPVYCELCAKEGKQVVAKVSWYDDIKLCILCLKKV